MTYILGLNFNHADSSAAILKNGIVLAAVEEERFNRIKHTLSFPKQSINYCLKKCGISINEVDYISINKNFYSNIFKKIHYSFLHPNFFVSKIMNLKKKNKLGIHELIKKNFP